MQVTENRDAQPNAQPIRESTRILSRNGRSGAQQYFDRGFGKVKNTDFEPMHYADT